MTWYLVADYTPSGGPVPATTSPGSIGNGFTDFSGNVWSISSSNYLQAVHTSGPWALGVLGRSSTSEYTVDKQITVRWIPGSTSSSNTFFIGGRYSTVGVGTSTGYFAGVNDAGTTLIERISSGSPTALSSSVTGSFTPVSGTGYDVTLQVVQTNSTTTTITLTIYDTSGDLLVTSTATDTTSALQNITGGAVVFFTAGSNVDSLARIRVYQDVVPSNATAYSINIPSTDIVGQLNNGSLSISGSGNYIASPLVVSLSDGASGTFSPNPVTLNVGVTSVPFTYTPASPAGPKTISYTYSGGNSGMTGNGSTTVSAVYYTKTYNSQLIPLASYNCDMFGVVYTSTGSGDISGTSQNVFKINVVSNSFRVLYANYAPFESSTMSSLTIQSSFQINADSGTPVQLTFSGNNSVTILPGQEVYTDWYTTPSVLSVGQFVAVRTYATWPSSGTLPTGPFTLPNNSSITGYTGTAGNNYTQHSGNGSNQLLTYGAASVWTSINNYYSFGPLTIDGFAADGVARPIVALVGDSIMQGYSDTTSFNSTADGTGGAAVRAMTSMGFPYYMLAKISEQIFTIYQGPYYTHRLIRAKRATVIFEEYGTNDLTSSGVTFAQITQRKLFFWQILTAQNPGIYIIPVTLLPRPTLSGNIYPASSQTPNSNNAVYQAFNAWLRAPYSAGSGNSATYDAAQYGIIIPYICDAASYIESTSSNTTPGGPSSPLTGGVWWCGTNNATAYSGDGTHPNSAGAIVMVPAFTGAMSYIQNSTPSSLKNKTLFFNQF